MLPDQHLSRVIFRSRRPTIENKAVLCSSPAYIKPRLDAHLLDKWIQDRRGTACGFVRRVIITGLKLITVIQRQAASGFYVLD